MGIDLEDDPHLRWFKLAKSVSQHSEYRIQVGCVLVKGNRPISVGFNKMKFNKLYSSPWKKSIHAEANAIQTAPKDHVKKAVAYIYRERSNGLPGLARPCTDCMQRLIAFGVRTIYYSTNEFPFYNVESI